MLCSTTVETVWELTDVFADSKSSALRNCAVSHSIIFYLLRQILILFPASFMLLLSLPERETFSLEKTVLLTSVSLVALAKVCLPWSFQILTPPGLTIFCRSFNRIQPNSNDSKHWRPKLSSYLPDSLENCRRVTFPLHITFCMSKCLYQWWFNFFDKSFGVLQLKRKILLAKLVPPMAQMKL